MIAGHATLAALAAAFNVSRQRVEKLMHDGAFAPLTSPPTTRGVARKWDSHDAARLVVLLRLMDLGVPAKIGQHIGHLLPYHDDRTFFVAELDRNGGWQTRTVRGREVMKWFGTDIAPTAAAIVDVTDVIGAVESVWPVAELVDRAASDSGTTIPDVGER